MLQQVQERKLLFLWAAQLRLIEFITVLLNSDDLTSTYRLLPALSTIKFHNSRDHSLKTSSIFYLINKFSSCYLID